MLFQTFDDKENCHAIYAKDRLYLKKIPPNLTKTWDYSECLRDADVEYAKYYCGGKSLEEACPSYYKSNWDETASKIKAFHRAAIEAKLNLNDHCFYDLFPPHFLLKYGEIKNRICSHVFKEHEKPLDYEFRVGLTKVLTEIKNKKLNVDVSVLKEQRHEFKVRQFLKKMKGTPPYIIYDMYGTKTGRLTAKQFPILTMDKSFRKILTPTNKWFLELDYNAAELRVMLALLNKEQPQEDIHKWNLKNVYGDMGTREKAKKRIFAWLYNSKSKDHLSNREYNREELLKKYWDETYVKTYFGRKIEADKHHALNYIIQSTAADLFLRQMIKVWELLKNKQSYITFCLHDSLVIDLAQEDEDMLLDIKEAFINTELGMFKANLHGGQNFGEMKRMNIY